MINLGNLFKGKGKLVMTLLSGAFMAAGGIVQFLDNRKTVEEAARDETRRYLDAQLELKTEVVDEAPEEEGGEEEA